MTDKRADVNVSVSGIHGNGCSSSIASNSVPLLSNVCMLPAGCITNVLMLILAFPIRYKVTLFISIREIDLSGYIRTGVTTLSFTYHLIQKVSLKQR